MKSGRRGECLSEAGILAERLNDDGRRGRVYALMTNIHSMLGQLDEARASGIRALAIAERVGDLELRILSRTYLEQVHHHRGEYAKVVELATDNLAALPADWIYETFGNATPASVDDRYWLIMSLAQLGRFAEAAEHEVEAIRLAEPTQHAFTIGQAYFAAGRLHLLKGDWPKARSTIEHGIGGARAGHVALLLYPLVASSAWVLAQFDDAGEALNRLREAEQFFERSGRARTRWPSRLELSRDGLRVSAPRPTRRGAAPGRPRGRILSEPPRVRGPCATSARRHRDHPDRFDAESGEAHYGKALALAEPRSMRPLVAHCHLGLGRLYWRTGNRLESGEHFAIATSMYREMGMTYWLEQAEAEMPELH